MTHKVLHIAPFNTSGVPIALVNAERRRGIESRLVTLCKDPRDYEEDICLNLPMVDFWGTRMMKRIVSNPEKLIVDNRAPQRRDTPLSWRPHNLAERLLVALRESLWRSRVERFMREIDFWSFETYQLDGGLEFFRDGRTVREMKRRGKRVICCYTGSDLRVRGVIPEIDRASDLNVTLEFDHLRLHPNIEHVFFPFTAERLTPVFESPAGKIRIGHAPTSRRAKGSDIIIATVQAMMREFALELELIEGVSFEESLRRKRSCHIFIDQIGDLGYGLNSLEALAMGIPTFSCLAPGFASRYPDHPFVVVNADNLEHELRRYITNPDLLIEKSQSGPDWVTKYHSADKAVERIQVLLTKQGGLRHRKKSVRDA